MQCEKCTEEICTAQPYKFKGKELCGDCYLDLAIGVPPVDISGLEPEVQASFRPLMSRWFRDRPNRHHKYFE